MLDLNPGWAQDLFRAREGLLRPRCGRAPDQLGTPASTGKPGSHDRRSGATTWVERPLEITRHARVPARLGVPKKNEFFQLS